MGGSTYPFFRFMRKVDEGITRLRTRKRVKQNLAYLTYCQKHGLDPDAPIKQKLNEQEKRRGKE